MSESPSTQSPLPNPDKTSRTARRINPLMDPGTSTNNRFAKPSPRRDLPLPRTDITDSTMSSNGRRHQIRPTHHHLPSRSTRALRLPHVHLEQARWTPASGANPASTSSRYRGAGHRPPPRCEVFDLARSLGRKRSPSPDDHRAEPPARAPFEHLRRPGRSSKRLRLGRRPPRPLLPRPPENDLTT